MERRICGHFLGISLSILRFHFHCFLAGQQDSKMSLWIRVGNIWGEEWVWKYERGEVKRIGMQDIHENVKVMKFRLILHSLNIYLLLPLSCLRSCLGLKS